MTDDGGALVPFPPLLDRACPRTLSVLVPVFLRWFSLIRRRSANTVRAYEADLVTFLAFCAQAGLTHPEAVKVQHVDVYLGVLLERDGLQPASVNRHLHALRSFWRWLQREGIARDNPPALADLLKVPKRLPKYLTLPEQDKLLAALATDRSPAGVRDYALHATGLLCGLRCSELASLRLEHVDRETGSLRVIGKGDKERLAPVVPLLVTILEDYVTLARLILLAGRHSPFLFVRVHSWGSQRAGQALGPKAIFYIVRKTLRQVLNREQAHPHMLRHSFASRVREHGGTLQDLQEAMGHANIATTARYSHLVTSSQRARMAALIAGPRSRRKKIQPEVG
jgi:integrase/recombinase XerD